MNHEITVRRMDKSDGYETVNLTDTGLTWGAHFKGTFTFERDVLNKLGLMGYEIEDWMSHADSEFIYFSGPVSNFDSAVDYLQNLPGGINNPGFGLRGRHEKKI